MNIRHANTHDIKGLLPLLSQLGYPCALEDLEARFIRFLNHPGYGIAVCDINREIVGFVAWSKSDFFVSDMVRFHIEDLIVTERSRGRGMGKKRITYVEDIVKVRRPAIVDLTSGLKRAGDGTHEFYKRLGYKNDGPTAKVYLCKEL